MLIKIKNFSLTELLIIVAILMILLSLLSPSLQKINQRAISVNCMSNRRSIGNIASVYEADYQALPPYDSNRITGEPLNPNHDPNYKMKGGMFYHYFGPYAGFDHWTWIYPNTAAQTQLELPGTIFTCPDYPVEYIQDRYKVGTGMTFYIEPAMTETVKAPGTLWKAQSEVNLSMISEPQATIYISEAGYEGSPAVSLGSYNEFLNWDNASASKRLFDVSRHDFSPVILFFDMHVEPLAYAELKQRMGDFLKLR